MARGKCGSCGLDPGDFAAQCQHCGSPNPYYSPANAWAAGVLGAALAGFAIWLTWQESFSVPTRSGGATVYLGWSLAGLAAEAAVFGAAFLGLAFIGDAFRGKARILVSTGFVLWLTDIAFRVAAD